MHWFVLVMLIAAPAAGQVVFDGSQVQRGSGPGLTTRPLDDSDPEMKKLADQYYGQGPCGRGPGRSCPDAGLPMEAGGDRMVDYLAPQYEEAFRGGHATQPYLNGIARTRSKAARQFILARIGSPRDTREHKEALYASLRMGDPAVCAAALESLRNAKRADVEATAMMAVGENLLRMEPEERPRAAIETLRRYAQEKAVPVDGMRFSQARHYLDELGETY